MRETELVDAAPGRLVPYGQRSYYRPNPLPPVRDLDLDETFYDLLSDATYQLGRLSGLGQTTDFAPVLYTSLLRKEAIESAEIEGANVDFTALYSAETRARSASDGSEARGEARGARTASAGVGATKDTREVLNYERAVEDGIDALRRGEEITVELLHALHETLLVDVPPERRETDTLGEFLLPAPEVIDGLMDALLTYVRTGGRYHPLINVALAHYQFETIHPYGDGNGHLGRLLTTLQLHDEGYLERPTFYLSEYFNRNKRTYIDRMEAVRTTGAWEDWLEFFLTGIERQARESIDRSLELRELHERYEDRYGEVTHAYARLARRLFENPYFTASEAAEMLDVERTTAYRAIRTLEAEGVLEEVTGNERYQEFRATEIFAILERPPRTY